MYTCCQYAVVLQYSFYGTSVIKACIEAGTHHIDICGEPGVSSCHCHCHCYV